MSRQHDYVKPPATTLTRYRVYTSQEDYAVSMP